MKKWTEIDRSKSVLVHPSTDMIWSVTQAQLVDLSFYDQGIFKERIPGDTTAAKQYGDYLESSGIQTGLVPSLLLTLMERELLTPPPPSTNFTSSKFTPLVKGEQRIAFSIPQKGKAKRGLWQILDLMRSGKHVLSTVRHNKDLGMHLQDIFNWKITSHLIPINVTKTSVSDLRQWLRSNEPRLFVGLSGAYTWGKMLRAINGDKKLADRLGLVDDEGDMFPLGLLILNPDARNKGEQKLHALMETCFAMMKLTATPGPLLMSLCKRLKTVAEEVQSQKIRGSEFRGFTENNFVPISIRHGAFDVSHPDFRKFWKDELTQGQPYSSLLINASMWCNGHSEELREVAKHHKKLPDDTVLMTMNHEVVRMYDKRMKKLIGEFSSRPKDAEGEEFGRPYADIQKAYSYCRDKGYNHRVVAGKLLVTRAGRFTDDTYKEPLTAEFYSDTNMSHLEEATQALGRTCGMVPVGTPKATNYCSEALKQEVFNWNYTDLRQIAKAINEGVPVDNVKMVGQYGRDLTRSRLEGLLEYQLRNSNRRNKNFGDY